jgi:ComF family protein
MEGCGLPAALLDVLLPERCVLCGEFVIGRNRCGPFPLCLPCAGRLAPVSGMRCVRCSRELISEQGLCMGCRSRQFPFESNFSVFVYDESLAELMLAYKARHQRRLKYFFAGVLNEAALTRWPELPLVPVPERREAMRRRGWGPVRELVRTMRRLYGREVIELLERRAGREQKGLSREERLVNMRTAISMRSRPASGHLPAEVLLVDDVFTTGATAEACTSVLKAAGVRSVRVLTLALD